MSKSQYSKEVGYFIKHQHGDEVDLYGRDFCDVKNIDLDGCFVNKNDATDFALFESFFSEDDESEIYSLYQYMVNPNGSHQTYYIKRL